MQVLQLYVSGNGVSDSLYNKVSENTISVTSLALDDFVEEMNLLPSLVKMDIEGAEYDALRGFERTIARARPLLILEQQIGDDRCLAWLLKEDITAIHPHYTNPTRNFPPFTRPPHPPTSP